MNLPGEPGPQRRVRAASSILGFEEGIHTRRSSASPWPDTRDSVFAPSRGEHSSVGGTLQHRVRRPWFRLSGSTSYFHRPVVRSRDRRRVSGATRSDGATILPFVRAVSFLGGPLHPHFKAQQNRPRITGADRGQYLTSRDIGYNRSAVLRASGRRLFDVGNVWAPTPALGPSSTSPI